MGKRGPKKGSPGRGAPPKKKVDWKVFEECCRIHCTREEIAAILDMDDNTVDRHVKEHYGKSYGAKYEELSKTGKKSLRRIVWSQAESGNSRVMLRLMEHELGMRAEQKIEHAGGIGIQDIKVEFVTPRGSKDPK